MNRLATRLGLGFVLAAGFVFVSAVTPLGRTYFSSTTESAGWSDQVGDSMTQANWNDYDEARGTADGDFAWTDASDTTYRTKDLRLYDFGFDIDPTATITGIEVTYTGRDEDIYDDVSVPDIDPSFDVRLTLDRVGRGERKEGDFLFGETSPPNTGTLPSDTFGGSADLWDWTFTPATINNASDHGLGVNLRVFYGRPDAICRVDSASITVYYTLPSSKVVHTQTRSSRKWEVR